MTSTGKGGNWESLKKKLTISQYSKEEASGGSKGPSSTNSTPFPVEIERGTDRRPNKRKRTEINDQIATLR